MTMQERDEVNQELSDLNFWGTLYINTDLKVERISSDCWYWSDIGYTYYHA
jgi:hypothetical protein